MATIEKNGKSVSQPPAQMQRQRPAQLMEEPISKPGMVEVVIRYIRQGAQVSEKISVPISLFKRIADQEKTEGLPLQAMKELADFHNSYVRPELAEVFLSGRPSMTASVLSSKIQFSYDAHAVIAATEKRSVEGLLLENEEVMKQLRKAAAILSGVDEKQIAKLPLEKHLEWEGETEGRKVVSNEKRLLIQEIECSNYSHHKKTKIPAKITVSEARTEQEQRIRKMPDIQMALDGVYGKIEGLRGAPLAQEERNAVVAHLNVRYIEDDKNWLIITP